MGDILIKTGRVREGEDYYRQALAIYGQQATKNYLLITQLKVRLSQSLLTQDRLPEAEHIAVEAYKEASNNLGARDRTRRAAADNLSLVYEKEGKIEAAQAVR